MRDPKTYAKILSQREDAMDRAAWEARSAGDHWRAVRATVLQGKLQLKIYAWRDRTGWVYSPWHDPEPHWTHITIIPDTEAAA